MIRPSSKNVNGSLNPLLQPDITADDLFVQYTPAEIANHLAAVKVQLQTYDSELRALINSRYQDVLAVGNTISAMRSSSTLLTGALDEVAKGLRRGIADGNEEEQTTSGAGEDKTHSTESQIRHVAALLLVLHEGPEEIWRILDAAKAASKGSNGGGEEDAASRVLVEAKSCLRTARRLALASSLFEAVRIAGQELLTMRIPGNDKDVKDLFPHPVSTHIATLTSLKVELQAAIQNVIGRSDVALTSDKAMTTSRISAATLHAGLEAGFRTTTISLVALVKLQYLAPAEAEAYLLQSRKETLKQWVTAAGGNIDPNKILDVAHASIAETCGLYERIFAKKLFNSILEQMAAAQDATQQPPPSSALLPPTPLDSIATLPSAERILSTMLSASPLLSWHLEVSDPSPSSDPRAIQSWMDDVTAALFDEWVPALIDSFSSIHSVGRAHHRLDSAFKRHAKVHNLSGDESSVLPTLSKAFESSTARLAARTEALWRQDIQRWRNDALHRVVGALASVETDQREMRLHQSGREDEGGLYAELFLVDSLPVQPKLATAKRYQGTAAAASTQGAATSKAHLQDLLEGKMSQVQSLLAPTIREWVQLARTLERYQNAVANHQGDADEEVQELQTLVFIATSGWTFLLTSLNRLVDERSGQNDQLMLLTRLVRALLFVPRYAKVVEQVGGRSEEVRQATDQLMEKRREILNGAWKSDVVRKAVSILTRERQAGDAGGSSSSGTMRESPSPRLIQALCILEEASDEVLPPLGAVAAGRSDERYREADLIRNVLADIHREAVGALKEQDAHQPTSLATDLTILEGLVQSLNGVSVNAAPEEALDPHALLLGRLAVALNASNHSKLGFARAANTAAQAVDDESDRPPSLLTLTPFREGGRIQSLTIIAA